MKDVAKGIDSVVRAVCIPYRDDKPKRRTWWMYYAKIGTTCGTVIWADKPELHIGDQCYFCDLSYGLDNKKKYVAYPSDNEMMLGTVDMINDEERVFIRKGV